MEPGKLFQRFEAKPTDLHVGTLMVTDGRIEHEIVDRKMNGETMVFVDTDRNVVIYAGTSNLNTNHLGRMSNHIAVETSHDWLTVYIRKFCRRVDLYLMADNRYDHLTTRSSNKKAQIKAAIAGVADDGSATLRAQLAKVDDQIADLLKQAGELHAHRASLVAGLFAAKG
ncbi:hypothetical protein [Bosea sp. ANAM02]|uniref:hypothetical protein n=1 Tax=Bosea sp. ANAM02 TaxID=2020412 RepID=UPI00140F0B64|nr:hypothetical protein [Bosea sp. ANAM02]BCB20292.1 hypothetical protein OCUBac02_31860 [Bosea sp. ANAM02]